MMFVHNSTKPSVKIMVYNCICKVEREGSTLTDTELLYKEETMSGSDFKEYLLAGVSLGLITVKQLYEFME